MHTIIISDDLSGAAGMASLISSHIPVVPYNKIDLLKTIDQEIISLDLETRNLKIAFPRLDYIKNKYPHVRILTRIDSLMRGSTPDFIKFMTEYGKIMLTDTIPEFGRRTSGGASIQKNRSINIMDKLAHGLKPFVTIADSSTYGDIQELAKKCIRENFIPIDPGMLIKTYLEML